MKSTFAVLLATTAVVGALGLPALAAMRGTGDPAGFCTTGLCAAMFADAGNAAPLIRVSGDDDDDDDDDDTRRRRSHDDDEDDDDDDCDDDDDDCAGARANPAPAGTVAPPANGLFGNGAPPRAVTN